MSVTLKIVFSSHVLLLVAFAIKWYLARTELSSSVTCYGSHRSNRVCRFKNLIYDSQTDKYLFSHGPDTKIVNVPRNRNNPALLDLSTVDDHNAMYFFYTDVTSKYFHSKAVRIVFGSSLLFHRFNPENLMHVFHDDLIPLFYTSRMFVKPLNNILAMDGQPNGPYFDLYKLYAKKVYTKSNFTQNFICFEDVIVGLWKDTTWYQYGFKWPQGPLEKPQYPVYILNEFKDDFFSKITHNLAEKSKYGVFVSRTTTRRILNEAQLTFKLSTHLRLPIHSVSIEDNDLLQTISLISNTDYVISVHGAQLTLVLFMKPKSVLIELFPYAVPPENYTPYKTLARILSIEYHAWANPYANKSVTHPDWTLSLGGIDHLPEAEQEIIQKSSSVPPHLCCDNPQWLYRIYQETIVDIPHFLSKLPLPKETSQNYNSVCLKGKLCSIVPCQVNSIACIQTEEILKVTWDPPWNLQYFNMYCRTYEIRNKVETTYKTYIVNVTSYSHPISNNTPISIFIRCKLGQNFGPFSKEISC